MALKKIPEYFPLDWRFGTDGIRCKVNQEPMTTDTCLKIAKAAGYLLSNKAQKKNRVIISKDTRLSGYQYEPLMTSGFLSMGMEVILVGPLPTPALPLLIKSPVASLLIIPAVELLADLPADLLAVLLVELLADLPRQIC